MFDERHLTMRSSRSLCSRGHSAGGAPVLLGCPVWSFLPYRSSVTGDDGIRTSVGERQAKALFWFIVEPGVFDVCIVLE